MNGNEWKMRTNNNKWMMWEKKTQQSIHQLNTTTRTVEQCVDSVCVAQIEFGLLYRCQLLRVMEQVTCLVSAAHEWPHQVFNGWEGSGEVGACLLDVERQGVLGNRVRSGRRRAVVVCLCFVHYFCFCFCYCSFLLLWYGCYEYGLFLLMLLFVDGWVVYVGFFGCVWGSQWVDDACCICCLLFYVAVCEFEWTSSNFCLKKAEGKYEIILAPSQFGAFSSTCTTPGHQLYEPWW